MGVVSEFARFADRSYESDSGGSQFEWLPDLQSDSGVFPDQNRTRPERPSERALHRELRCRLES